MTDLFAAKGEIVRCENGHKICRVLRDIKIGQVSTGDEFGEWKIAPPAVGDIPKPCPCGALWWGRQGVGNLAQSVHFADGWR